MRRVRCIVCFTGAAFDVPVTPAANRQQVTVDDLVRQLQEQESVARGAPIRIDVVTDGSGTFGPPRGLAPDDELPSSTDPANVFLVFASKYVDRFPRAKIETAALVNEHHARQVLAYGCMLAPADHHLKTSLDEFSRAHACAQAITQDFEARVAALPEAMKALGKVRLVSDPETTLAQRVGDFGGLVDSGKKELAHADDGLARTKGKYDAIQQRLAECRVIVPAAAGSASQSHIDAMSRAIEERIEALKGLLKSTERVRLDVGKLLQGVKAVRDGVLLKMSMIASLPEAYAAAIQLAGRRLTFNKAAVRIRQMLAVEHGAICDETAAFFAQFGSRFPTNIGPGIAMKPPLPTFDDPVADVLRPHMVDLEEDPVSELLARLGIGRAAPHPAAAQHAHSAAASAEGELARLRASHTSDLAVLRAELESVRAELESGEAKHRQARDELRSAQTRAEEAESDAARYQQERAMFAEARDGLQKQLDALTAQISQRDHTSSAHQQQCAALETRVAELSSQVEALQVSLESADAARRDHERELEAEKAQLTEMAGRLSEQSDELEQALAVVKAERGAREVAESRSRKVAVASAYHVLASDEQAARAQVTADASIAVLDTHSQLLRAAAVLRTTAAASASAPGSTTSPVPEPAAPSSMPVTALSGDALSAEESASFGRTITLTPSNFATLEAKHTGANGHVNHETLHLALFEELHFEMRPLKFAATVVKGSLMSRERVFLDANRNGFVVRATYDPVKDAAVVERAKHERFVFGQLVVITNTQRTVEGQIVISGHVSFSQE